ncbi:MAG: hypothetical protein EOP92_32270 [Lysobacteraceae bacterium]|nr:MAG: hypothetical protein EOP92_32270 [Xanthomonadaceae bacterium]
MKPIPTETGTDVGNVGKWLGAAAAGALLMYLLDPERGRARRARAGSALRDAGARTGATVDHVLHNAGDRLVGLKDSAASALSRGADRLQAQAAPMLERARHGAQEATQRLEDSAERARAAARKNTWEGADARSYQPSRQYGADSERGGLAGMLRSLGLGGGRADRGDAGAAHPALLGGGVLGLLSLMRRSPGGLLVGLAGLALLMQASRDKTYRVSENMPGKLEDTHDNMRTAMGGSASRTTPLASQGEQDGNRYLH